MSSHNTPVLGMRILCLIHVHVGIIGRKEQYEQTGDRGAGCVRRTSPSSSPKEDVLGLFRNSMTKNSAQRLHLVL